MNPIIEEKLKKIKNSIWSFFIERRPVTWILILGIIGFGAFSFVSMNREIQPEINVPYGVVMTSMPGANPSDVESLITEPLEKQLGNIDDIETLSSSSGFGSSSIFIEFTADSDMNENLTNMKDAIDLAKGDLPEDASDPVAVKADASDYVIIAYSISGNRDLYEITEIAKDVKDDLELISGVANIDIIGGQQKIIEVTLDQKKVEGYGLDIQTISSLIEAENNNLPVGIVSSDKLNYSVRIDNRYQSIDEIANLPLFTLSDSNSTPILLKDLATIEEAFPKSTIISKFSQGGDPSAQAVTLNINKKDSADIITTVEAVEARMEELKTTMIPDDLTVGISTDLSVYVTESLGILTQTGMQTTLLIMVIMFLALGLRQGLIAGLSIPMIFLITFIIMEVNGLTLNSLSLFSLVIALGLIVDTTIVIMEGIYDNLKQGLKPKEAALISVYTYKWPVIAGTLTTVFAFFPLLLVSGIMGEFLKTLPITISAALLASLFTALFLAPSVAGKFAKKKEGKKYISLLEPIFHRIGKVFHRVVARLISTLAIRNTIIITSVLLFVAVLMLPITGALKVNMFPSTDQYTFLIEIETPKGTILEETQKVAEEIEAELYDIPEVKNFVTNIGTSQSAAGFSEDLVPTGPTSDSNIANITVNLTDKEARERTSISIAEELRQKIAGYTMAEITVSEFDEGPPSDAAITARITGDDMDKLKEIASQIETLFNETDGILNVNNSLEKGLNEFKFTLDKDRLTFHGLSSIQVSAMIRNIIQGIDSTSITIDGEDENVFIKYNLSEENERTNISIHDIENFEIQSPKGYMVSLSDLGDYDLGESLSSISREDQKRIIKVTSDIEADKNVVNLTAEIEEKVGQLDLPGGYNISFGGDMEQINESFRDLFRSMAIGVVLIGFTLVLVLNSFRQTIIVLSIIPLAMIGVFPGLMAIGLDLSFPAFLGVVALAGIVVNDSIVLVDRINSNREEGKPFTESIAEAAEARLQPILMTSITTIIGILPLALTDKFWAGLGFALVFGLAASTVLTLIVLPSLYYKLEKKQARKEGHEV